MKTNQNRSQVLERRNFVKTCLTSGNYHIVNCVDTPDTRETYGFSCMFHDVTIDDFSNVSEFDEDVAEHIVHSARMGNAWVTLGPYKIAQYVDMFVQLENMSQRFTEATMNSRQFIIRFAPLHCFQNMQFLFRGEELIVITSMRSCNLMKNFMMDTYLSWYAASMVRQKAQELWPCSVKKIHVIMNIGSLHMFKEDMGEENVLRTAQT